MDPLWPQWQEDREDGSGLVGLCPAFHLNRSFVPANNLRAYPKPEASSRISLGADKWLKERPPDCRLNPGAAIRDSQTDARTRPITVFTRVGCTDPQDAPSP